MERSRIALIGLGEAGVALGAGVAAVAYDRLIDSADTRDRLIRRAAEMIEVVKTLNALGTGSAMATATVVQQRAVGALGLTPADGLDAKLDRLLAPSLENAA